MEGPWGLGLPSHMKGSKEDPPSSHFRCRLGLSVLTSAGTAPHSGLRFRFPAPRPPHIGHIPLGPARPRLPLPGLWPTPSGHCISGQSLKAQPAHGVCAPCTPTGAPGKSCCSSLFGAENLRLAKP